MRPLLPFVFTVYLGLSPTKLAFQAPVFVAENFAERHACQIAISIGHVYHQVSVVIFFKKKDIGRITRMRRAGAGKYHVVTLQGWYATDCRGFHALFDGDVAATLAIVEFYAHNTGAIFIEPKQAVVLNTDGVINIIRVLSQDLGGCESHNKECDKNLLFHIQRIDVV